MKPEDKELELATSLLEKVGFHVLQASNFGEALEKLSEENYPSPLLIIDEGVSPASVFGMLETARSLNPAVRVLLMSERDDSEAARLGKSQANVNGFLKKPFRRANFLGSVLKLTGESRVRTA
jgi:DNA-binding response OmpR family regulator